MTKNKKTIQRTVSVLMAMVMILLATPIGGFLGMGMDAFAKEIAVSTEEGPGTIADLYVKDIIEFGSYPQTKVTDTYTLSKLNAMNLSWRSYGYYSGESGYSSENGVGTMAQGDWMQYADVTFNGEKYRAVKFSQYRPYRTSLTQTENNSYQDDRGYRLNNIYWFKYEPLKWRVLDPSIGLVMCETVIDSQPFNNTAYYKDGNYFSYHLSELYASNYYYSSIRNWLNDDFYNLAFSEDEKEWIINTPNNDDSSTGFNSGTAPDNVFLLSLSEMKKSEYGFSTGEYRDDERKTSVTDYAKSQGEKIYVTLRTASGSKRVYAIDNDDGRITGQYTDYASFGIRPAIRIPDLRAQEIPVKGIDLNHSTYELGTGRKLQLEALISPINATNKNVTWESSYTAVATVDENGLVTAKTANPDPVIITATTEDRELKATCEITVFVSVTGVILNSSSESMSVGQTKQLSSTVRPNNAKYKGVTWSTSDPNVVTVSQSGEITAVSGGTATVTVTTNDGGYTATCVVTVNQPVTGVTLNCSEKTMFVGGTFLLTATVSPSDATNKEVTWSSSDTSVATVSSAGRVTARSAGNVEITATTSDGEHKATCYITILNEQVYVTGVSLNYTILTMYVGEGDEQLAATVSPSDATDKGVTWSSSNTSVATVDSTGKVKAVSAGTATITVTTDDGSCKATCSVTVIQPVTGVTVSPTSKSMTVGNTYTLTATVSPSNATNKNLTWRSDNTSVATVDSTGKVTAKSAGTATITVTTQDGSHTAQCTVTVSNATVYVTGVSVSPTSKSMTVGNTYTLTATVSPSNATNKNLTWKSSNTSVATVDSTGKVTAKSAGTATITVTTQDGSHTAQCTVTVSNATVYVTGVTVSPTSKSMTVGNTYTLTATVSPSNATNKNLTWRSDNTSVATVDSTGKVTAKSAGTATITVTTQDGSHTAQCTVTVSNATVYVTGVTVSPTSKSMTVGNTYTLTATVSPSNATNKSVTWSSSNTSVATVDSTGKVTAKSAGTATITVTTKDGSHTAQCTVTVSNATVYVTGVTVSPTSKSMTVGNTYTLTATVSPSNATNKSVTWSSSNTSVATVDSTGKVTAKSAGTATITVTTKDGSYTAKCTVTVSGSTSTVPVTGVSLAYTSKSVAVGGNYWFFETISPSNATNKGVTWSSSNTNVAKVDSWGFVTGVSVGTAIITVTTVDGGYTATCEVTVTPAVPVTGVSLDCSSASVGVGGTYRLSRIISPSDATNINVTWSSSNTNVATVNSYGDVTGVSLGTAIITVTTKDGGYTATCVVTVTPAVHVTGVSLEYSSISVGVGGLNSDLYGSYMINPSNASNKNVTWSSSNTNVATVDGVGGVRGVSVGTAIITVTTKDGGYTATCVVTVRPAGAVTDVRLYPTSKEIYAGDTSILRAIVSPSDAINQSVTWSSSNTNVATVDSTGKVTAISGGTATITVTTVDGGYTATCVVTVLTRPVTGVRVYPTSKSMYIGDTYTLDATVSPWDATNESVTWSSSNTNVATVDSTGKVTAKAEGTATITVTTVDGGYTATCTVTVSKKTVYVSGVSLDVSSKTINIGGTYQLTATVRPSNATNKGVTWKSNDTSVATVDSTGKVTAKGEGTATITVTTDDGSYRATCKITVVVPVTGISLDCSSKTLYSGDWFELRRSISPIDATDRRVTWTSSNSDVARYDVYDGRVVAVSEGTAIITVTSYDGGYTAKCVVTVLKSEVTGVNLTSSNTELTYNHYTKLNYEIFKIGYPNYTREITSSNNNVATVDNYGEVRGVGRGTARITITVTDADGNIYTDYCDVTVKFTFGQWLLFIFCFGWIWM